MMSPGSAIDPGSIPGLVVDGGRFPAPLIGRLLSPEIPPGLSGPAASTPLVASPKTAGPACLEGTAPFSTPSLWPVRGWIVSGFGPYPSESSRFNTGLCIASRAGAPILAPAAGVVVAVGRDSRPGRYVILDHGRGLTTRLGRVRPGPRLKPGVRVKRGQIIGVLAHTAAPRLHYEVRVCGVPVNPGRYLPGWSTTR
jgi:murein DD-endopeptidase MepM/ murein hydrolase activator NlpD